MADEPHELASGAAKSRSRGEGCAVTRILLAAVLALAACSRQSAPGASATYRAADGSFSVAMPGDWKVDESQSGARRAAFYGPPGGARPFSQVIAVSFHAAGAGGGTGAAYVAQQTVTLSGPPRPAPPPGATDVTTERAVPSTHGGPSRENLRVVAVDAAGGFFILEHAWPLDAAPDPAFEAFRASFKPRSN
jgi:hypothetical protein